MEQLSLRTARKLITKLHVQDGDIVVIKLGSSIAETQNIDSLVKALEARGHTRTLVVVAENPADMTVLDETEMNRQGWYRIEALQSKILKKSKDNGNAESGSADI
jgi:hypothetical protein